MARNKRKNDGADMDPNGWMVTFGDLIMLLLTFFVMLLSMSSMDTLALKKLFSVLEGAVGPLELVDTENVRPVSDLIHNMAVKDGSLLDDGNKLKGMLKSGDSELQATMKRFGVEANIYNDSRGVVVSFKASVLFDSGQADIKPEVLPIFKRLGEIMEVTTNDILIIGHADNVPIRSDKYRSNWELSFFRGLSCLNYFLQESKISPERLCVGGAGDSQPRYPNTTATNREKNRRIEIIFRN